MGDRTVFFNNKHLLQRLERIQSFNYEFRANRNDIRELGTRGTADRPVTNSPEVHFDLGYLVGDVGNELWIGLNPFINIAGSPLYTGYYTTCFVSGIGTDSRTLDKRNFYLAIKDTDDDLRVIYPNIYSNGSGSLQDFYDPNSPDYNVVGITNCYLSSYRTEGKVGDFSRATLSYIADSITFFASGSGIKVPNLDSRSGEFDPAAPEFVIPRFLGELSPTVVRPGDITLELNPFEIFAPDSVVLTSQWTATMNSSDIGSDYILQASTLDNPRNWMDVSALTSGTGGSLDINDGPMIPTGTRADWTFRFLKYPRAKTNVFGIDLSNPKIQSYSINFTLEREDLRVLGYKFPVDRPVLYPVNVDTALTVLLDNQATGTINSALRSVDGIDIRIQIANPTANPIQGQETAIRYDIKGATFEGCSYQDELGQNIVASLNFRTEMALDALGRGLFVSGMIPIPTPIADIINSENFDRIVDEFGNHITSAPYYLGLHYF